MISRRVFATALCAALVVMSSACDERDHSTDDNGAELGAVRHAPVADTARAGTDPVRTIARATLEPGALGTVFSAPVDGWKGPGDQPFEVTLRTTDPASVLSRRFGTITLGTSLRARAPDLGQYPCTSCHLGRRMVLADDRVADAHDNIKSMHPAQTGAICSTCHAPDDVELLALKSGERATLDHAYRLCAQCHFSQAESWAGGAHGKRLDGWQGRRVVMGCADCHDPHAPALEPRIPFRAPQIERIRGRRQ